MANWYTSRESVKRALGIHGSSRDSIVDEQIEAAAREIDELVNSRFIPLTEENKYPWGQRDGRVWSLYLHKACLAVTALTKTGDTENAIASTDYFLEPSLEGPPYFRIDIDLASTEYFEAASDTHQQAIHVTGRWAESEDTVTGGTVTSGLASSSSATSMVCGDGSLIDVGDTLLIQSEQIFVSERTNAAEPNSDLLDGALTADITEAVTVDDGSRYNAGEVILFDSEKMLIETITGNVLSGERAYDGTTLAAHNNDTPVHVFRTLTIVRGVNGTTAATHANTTAISKYQAPADVRNLCRAIAIGNYQQEHGGWLGMVGTGEASIESRMTALNALRVRVKKAHKRHVMGVA